MRRGVNGAMGQVNVEFTVVNDQDLTLAEKGTLPQDQVRKVRVKGLVDTGANWLVLPKAVADHLALPATKPMLVEFGDGRLELRDVVDHAWVEMCGRHGTFRAIVEPNRSDALIGAIVLEDLDLLVDCSNQVLQPRNPEHMTGHV
jgi:predicted aspartyl protease